jgi:hypothetical protein
MPCPVLFDFQSYYKILLFSGVFTHLVRISFLKHKTSVVWLVQLVNNWTMIHVSCLLHHNSAPTLFFPYLFWFSTTAMTDTIIVYQSFQIHIWSCL